MRGHAILLIHVRVGRLTHSSSRSMSSFEVEAVFRGYHVYKKIGEELICARELANLRDL